MVSPNQEIGRYTLKRRLASGGMGEVYLAEYAGAANFSKEVAIKCILPHLAQNLDFVQKFIDEANLMVQLQHGSIVPVIELFEEDGLFYLVMEYVPGRDLKAVIRALKTKKEFMPYSIALWIVKCLGEALGYAHDKKDQFGQPLGVIHRDVSPSNVILGASGEVKLLDFGIAKARSRIHQSISGTLQGKFVYMSPEVADGREIDPRTDLFSLGLVLYELLTHTRPFDGDSETAILRNARNCEIMPPSLERPDLKPELDALVMRALQKDPNQRYANAFEFVRAINNFCVRQDLHPSSSALASFLKTVFPNGVVDESAKEVGSIDDALLQQLNALTPSLNKAFQQTITTDETRTVLPLPFRPADEPHDLASTPPSMENTEDHGGNKLGQIGQLILLSALVASSLWFFLNTPSTEIQSLQQRTASLSLPPEAEAAGRSKSASLPKTDSALEMSDQGQFEIDVKGSTIGTVKLTINGEPFSSSQMYRRAVSYVLCASDDTSEQVCHTETLNQRRQPITLQFKKEHSLSIRVVNLEGDYDVTVNDETVRVFPVKVKGDLTYKICVMPRDRSFKSRCQQISGGNLRTPVEFDFNDARGKPVKNLERQQISLPRHAEIRSIPTAQVLTQGQKIGFTPFRATPSLFGKTITLRAKGYIDTQFSIPKTPKTQYQVNLKQPGYLTLRVHPPASSIVIDGQQVGTGYLLKSPTKPGIRRVEARFVSASGEVAQWGPEDIKIEAGKETRLPVIRLKRSRRSSNE